MIRLYVYIKLIVVSVKVVLCVFLAENNFVNAFILPLKRLVKFGEFLLRRWQI